MIFIKKLDFSQVYFHLFVIAITVGIYLNIQSPQRYWLIYSALSFSLLVANQEFIYRPFYLSILCLLISILCFVINFVVMSHGLVLVLVALIFCAIYFVGYYSEFLLAAIIGISFMMVSVYQPLNLQANIFRSVFLSVGGLIVIIGHFLFLANLKVKIIKTNLLNAAQQLQSLFEQIFVCLIVRDYIDNQYLYERRLHVLKNKYFYYLRNIKEFNLQIKNLKTHEYITGLINKFDCLYDATCDCAQLRNRIVDYSTLQICNKELLLLARAINQLFVELIFAIKINKTFKIDKTLYKAINDFEDNYQYVLKASAREPLFFLLFIQALKKVQSSMNEISQLLPIVTSVKNKE